MEKEFVEYELAVKLKALGFDEPCLGYYAGDILCTGRPQEINLDKDGNYKKTKTESYPIIAAPTFSQAFRFFRKEHDLHPYIITLRGEWIVIGIIRCSDAEKITGSFDTNFNTLEEAEIECLKKLIEIVKQK